MTNAIKILIFIAILGAAFLSDAKSKDVPMTVIEDCIFKELRDCGDKLCEMSYDSNYPILEQAFDNLKECIKAAK